MVRHHLNKHEKFRNQSLANLREVTELLKGRQEAMQQQWSTLDKVWETLPKKMSEVGLSTASTSTPDTVLFNVGGSDQYVLRSVLEKMEGTSVGWTLGDLFGGGVWDERLPRDSDGNIVLDESPACVSHLINEFSKMSGAQETAPGLSGTSLAAADRAYLPYVARALGLSPQLLPPAGIPVTGGSTVLAYDIGPLTATMATWCPGEAEGFELLYRASRDGWTAAAFHDKCGLSSSTITLVRTKAHGSDTTDCIVGGFSSVSWTRNGSYGYYRTSPGAFLFMLKDGSGSGGGTFQPTRWGIKGHQSQYAVMQNGTGPIFGGGMHGGYDLWVDMNVTPATLQTRESTYDIPAGSPYLALDGRPVVEVEVFRVYSKGTTPPIPTKTELPTAPERTLAEGLIDCSAIFDASPMSTEEHERDVHQFGVSIAESLESERMALYHAQLELIQASAKAAASRNALAALYGPEVAAGKKDPVVELSVRGSTSTAKVTTLLSTLQACPDSALARRFNEKWTESEDAYGRPVIKDCSPAVFFKVLDVLRMRKRAAWASSMNGQDAVAPTARVAVKVADRDSFLRYVNMYFVGCEGFITDFVEFGQYP